MIKMVNNIQIQCDKLDSRSLWMYIFLPSMSAHCTNVLNCEEEKNLTTIKFKIQKDFELKNILRNKFLNEIGLVLI